VVVEEGRGSRAAERLMPRQLSLPSARPAADQVPPFDRERELVYRDVTVLTRRDRVRGFFIYRGHVRTEGKVGLGDRLSLVRDAYPQLDCAPADYEEYGTVKKCDGKVGRRRHVWFGGDPVDVIYVQNSPIGR